MDLTSILFWNTRCDLISWKSSFLTIILVLTIFLCYNIGYDLVNLKDLCIYHHPNQSISWAETLPHTLPIVNSGSDIAFSCVMLIELSCTFRGAHRCLHWGHCIHIIGWKYRIFVVVIATFPPDFHLLSRVGAVLWCTRWPCNKIKGI